MHSYGILHGDIKPDNIFITNNIVKIGDFGLSSSLILGNSDKKTTCVYTLGYHFPKFLTLLIKNEGYLNKIKPKYSVYTDVWAMGVVFLQMITGYRIFSNNRYLSILLEKIYN